ncbi:MAG: protein kinase [Planctomycetota bacterium]
MHRKRSESITAAIQLALESGSLSESELETVTAGLPEILRGVVDGARSFFDDAARFPEIEHYEILGIAGRGATAIVYRAYDGQLDRPVAIKVIEDAAWSEQMKRRALNEAKLLAAVEHEAVIPIYGFGETRSQSYMVMGWVPGAMTLRDLMDDAKESLEVDQRASHAVPLLARVGDGLSALHAHGIVHRDVKPENILVATPDETLAGATRAVLVDLGIAHRAGDDRMTQTGGIVGTPRFLAPEQIQDRDFDARTDVFALGACLYDVLADRSAVPAVATFHAPVEERFPADLLPSSRRLAPLRAIALQALQERPERRFQTAAEMKEALDAWAEGRPVRVTGVPFASKVESFVRTYRVPLAAALVSVVAILGWTLGSGSRGEPVANLSDAPSVLAMLRELEQEGEDLLVGASLPDVALESLPQMRAYRDRLNDLDDEEDGWSNLLHQARKDPARFDPDARDTIKTVNASFQTLLGSGDSLFAEVDRCILDASAPPSSGTRGVGAPDPEGGWQRVYLRGLVPRRQWDSLPADLVELETSNGIPGSNRSIQIVDTGATLDGRTPAEAVRALQEEAVYERGLGDIDYHFLVAPDGTFLRGRGLQWGSSVSPAEAIRIGLLGSDSLSSIAEVKLAGLVESMGRNMDRTLLDRVEIAAPGRVSESVEDDLAGIRKALFDE